MHGHMVKVRLSNLIKYSDLLPCRSSLCTQVIRQGSYTSMTDGHTPKSLWSNVVFMKRPFMHSHNCNRLILHDPVARLYTKSVRKKTEIKLDGTSGTSDKKKTREDTSPMILLIDDRGKVSYVSLSQAERMAKRKDLKVVKDEDSSLRTKDKQVYKLLTGRQYYEEEVKSKRSSKSSDSKFQAEKMLTLSAKIATHDLKSKLKNVQKWLSKGLQVRVTLMSGGATKEDMENVYATIENEIQSVKGCILQRHEKLGRLKFLIDPPKEIIENREETENQDDQTHHMPSEGTADKYHKVIHEAGESTKLS